MHLFVASFLVFVLHLPFVFAKTIPPLANFNAKNELAFKAVPRFKTNPSATAAEYGLYDALQLGVLGLSHQAFDYAIKGWLVMKSAHALVNTHILSIIDFSKSSAQKRLFIIDLAQATLLFNTYVAHGAQSGEAFATKFSNRPESKESSLGFYTTLGTYIGGNGYSLKLKGLEKGFNDNANKRAIVVHGAPYVDESFIRSRGYIGRSWGCPALPQQLHKAIIDTIKNGTCLFIFNPNQQYLRHSAFLNAAQPNSWTAAI